MIRDSKMETTLRDLQLKREYRSFRDDIVNEFYIPALKNAILYQRAVGFFSSSALVEISKGIAQMAHNGGKIQLVVSPYLSDDDIKAIRKGYEERNKIIERALMAGVSKAPTDYYSLERLNLLASLISDGIMDIQVAYTEDFFGIGMYHEKMGIIEDYVGNKIAFSGSNNESAAAMHINYEAMDVFRSWGDFSESDRVKLKGNAFSSIWQNSEPNVNVVQFPNVTNALIEKYRKKEPNFNIDNEQFGGSTSSQTLQKTYFYEQAIQIGPRVPASIELREYQKDAIATWADAGYRGIFDMATGTGKTYTALGAISRLSEHLDDKLAVIIVCPFQHLVEQWVDDISKFNMNPIIGYSGSSQKDWKKRLQKAIRDQKLRSDKSFFCFVCTNSTFASKTVQEEIGKIRSSILLVVDEAHNFGAQSYTKLLDDRFDYRLALSATLDRHRDKDGTDVLYNFFGKKCIEYSLEKAIEEDKLTKYKYHPIVVYLTEDELQIYEQKTFEMSKCLIKGKDGKYKLNKRGEILALERSRIIAGASQKLNALREQIKPYIKDDNILVYCGATSIVDELSDSVSIDDEEIRQIEAVTKILGNEFNMKVAKFTSKEKMETRATIIDNFQKSNGLQAIVAIKCLDEGVNIPGIRTAFILASTTNPKEYIQRRGRVLRKAENKPFAEIYDFVTLPRSLNSVSALTREQAMRDLSLVKNELTRIKEFGRLSMNQMEANDLIWQISDTYHILDSETTEGVEL